MITFKLTDQLTETTRRLTLTDSPPSWSVLAARISFLFSIPANNVAVSYVDNDGDEVTLSTDDELEEYYNSLEFRTSANGNGGVKLLVKDLASLRAWATGGGDSLRTPPTIIPGRESHASTSLDDLFGPHTPYRAPSFGPIAEESPWMPMNRSPFTDIPMHDAPIMVQVDDQGRVVRVEGQPERAGTEAHISVVETDSQEPDIVDTEVGSIPSGIEDARTPRAAGLHNDVDPVVPISVPYSDSPKPVIIEDVVEPIHPHISPFIPAPSISPLHVERELPAIPSEELEEEPSPVGARRLRPESGETNPPAYTPTPEPPSPTPSPAPSQGYQHDYPGPSTQPIYGYHGFDDHGFDEKSALREKDALAEREREFEAEEREGRSAYQTAHQSEATFPDLRPSTMRTTLAMKHSRGELRVRNPDGSDKDSLRRGARHRAYVEEVYQDADDPRTEFHYYPDEAGTDSMLDANVFSEHGKTASRFGVPAGTRTESVGTGPGAQAMHKQGRKRSDGRRLSAGTLGAATAGTGPSVILVKEGGEGIGNGGLSGIEEVTSGDATKRFMTPMMPMAHPPTNISRSQRSRAPSASTSRFGNETMAEEELRDAQYGPGGSFHRPDFAGQLLDAYPMPAPTIMQNPMEMAGTSPFAGHQPLRTPQRSPATFPIPAPARDYQERGRGPPTPAITPLLTPAAGFQSGSGGNFASGIPSDKSVFDGEGAGSKKGVMHVPVIAPGGTERLGFAELAPAPISASVAGDRRMKTPMTHTRTPIQPAVDLRAETDEIVTETTGRRDSFLRDLTTLLETISGVVEKQPELGRAWKRVIERVRTGEIGPEGYLDTASGGTEVKRIVDAMGELVDKLDATELEDGESGERKKAREKRLLRNMEGLEFDPHETYHRAMERRVLLDEAREKYQTEKELFRAERDRLRIEKEELRRLREEEREKQLQERSEAKAKAKEERREAKRGERRERERNWNRVAGAGPSGNWEAPQTDYPSSFMVHASQFPNVNASNEVPFIPPSPPRSPFMHLQSAGHLDLRGGAGTNASYENSFQDNSKRVRRKVTDVRRGGKWEDLMDPGSDLEEKMTVRSRHSVQGTKSAREVDGKYGVEVSLGHILERLAQVGVHCDPMSCRQAFLLQLGKLEPKHPATEELDKDLEDEIFDWLLEDHIASGAIQPQRQDRIVKIRSSGTFGRVSPYDDYGVTGMGDL